MKNLNTHTHVVANKVIEDYFIDERAYYLQRFGKLPHVNFYSKVDGEKLLACLQDESSIEIMDLYQRQWYDHKKKRLQFDRAVVELKGDVVLELRTECAFILHGDSERNYLKQLEELLLKCKSKSKKDPKEINLIVKEGTGLCLKSMEIKSSKLDVGLYYNDDFEQVDKNIQARLRRKDDKGIVLLHGLPGTGKTTYLRYLVGKVKKKVLFVSPSIAGELTNPDLIQLLIENPNSILVIEDAENIIMNRRYNSSSSVSTLLNISDGLLSDFLNVQLICTFNSELANIDEALLRKGRLIARYEFGKLSIEKSRQLAAYLKQDVAVTQPMTLAEITNATAPVAAPPQTNRIGFRRLEETIMQDADEMLLV